ncbi:hypothetical protein, partial [Propionibacterium acidifaciens]|uniref:hypothetical protein n=1 Tax=Propionibacterium acidifaciens TaxID=556499 RepID=UPI0028EC06F7
THNYYVRTGNHWTLAHNNLTCDVAEHITPERLQHSFDRHAAQWFGGDPQFSTHGEAWQQLIERATQSTKIVPWSTGGSETVAHIARIEGKNFLVQYYQETGDLATAFVPNNRQVSEILERLGK